jgi:glutaredoxin
MMNIVLYTTHCPKCIVLENKLNEKNIEYIENNDVDEMLNKGWRSAPVLEVDGTGLMFKEAVDWVNSFGKDE